MSELSLFVGVDCYYWSSVCRETIARTFATVGASWDWREEVFDFFLHLVNIDIAYNYNALKVWTVPKFVVVAESLVCEVVDNGGIANYVSFGILRACIFYFVAFAPHTALSCVALTPFFADYATFVVDFFFLKVL